MLRRLQDYEGLGADVLPTSRSPPKGLLRPYKKGTAFGPFVYWLGRQPFKLEEGDRNPYGLPRAEPATPIHAVSFCGWSGLG
jgi:hypothetical protein